MWYIYSFVQRLDVCFSDISNYSLISSTDKWIIYTFDSNYYQKTPLTDTYPEFDHIYSSRIGFPGDSVVKKRRPRFDPWVRKIPWRRKW